MTKNVAIFVFENVEVLDFAGPFEVFHVSSEQADPPPFNTYLVAQTADPVRGRGGFTVVPHYAIDDMPQPDILVIPGGQGTRALLHQEGILAWVRDQHARVERLLSVCTGSLVLGKAGLLNGLESTTHHGAFEELRIAAPDTIIREDTRYVDNGKIVTSGGISAGIDMALHVVGQIVGDEIVQKTLKEMEYSPR